MNLPSNELLLEAQRGRQWTQLMSQQVRLRHISQIMCLNLDSANSNSKLYYFTLHLTMMSSPFYTSEKIKGSHLKWLDISIDNFSSVQGVVLRIWQDGLEEDKILITLGIYLSGLIYIGNKPTDIQPCLFHTNTVIFFMNGGFFTNINSIHKDVKIDPKASIDDITNNVGSCLKLSYKYRVKSFPKNELKNSYKLNDLRKLHYTQILIKNKCLDTLHLQEKISNEDVLLQKPAVENDSSLVSRQSSQLLTRTFLNKMLEVKPTRSQKQEMFKLNKLIEIAKSRTKLLNFEKNRKTNVVANLQKNYSVLLEKNLEKESNLMDNYHSLKREKERLRQYQTFVHQHRELLVHLNSQLQHRKKQLLQELLVIYPIHQISDTKFTINGVHLPNSDVLSDCADNGISVALGYVTHVLLMCSIFLQVPLRHPVTHYGSRSYITDQISNTSAEKDFPLFMKGKDRMQFTYGVYLLNKNIAQLRWIFLMNTPDLKSTLSNLLSFLQGYKEYKQDRFMLLRTSLVLNESPDNSLESNSSITHLNLQKLWHMHAYESSHNLYDPILESLRHEKHLVMPFNPASVVSSKKNKEKSHNVEECPGLSEILAIPEAFLNKQISSQSLKNYILSDGRHDDCSSTGHSSNAVNSENHNSKRLTPTFSDSKQTQCNCDIHVSNNYKEDIFANESIEEGTDLLNPKSTLDDLVLDTSTNACKDSSYEINIEKTVFESISSLDKESETELLIDNSNESETHDGISGVQQGFLENWLRTGPALVCSDKNLYPEEHLGSTSTHQDDSPLTARTDALLNTKSFNLVKPKH